MADPAPANGRVLVVIPCLNEEGHIGAILDILLADVGDKGLIVVADGGSTDRSRQIVGDHVARHPGRVILMDNPARLQAAGVNAAVEAYGDDATWLVRVDAHGAYPDGYVSRLMTAAVEQDADAVVVPLYSVGTSRLQVAVAAAQNSPLGTGGAAHRHPGKGAWVDHGHHALIRLARFREVGGYDPTFGQNEDAEFDVRLRQAGGRIWLNGELAVEYYPRDSFGRLFKQYYLYGRGRCRTIRKHRVAPKLRQTLPLAVLPATLLLPFALVWPILALPAAVWIGASLVGGAALAWKNRRVSDLLAGPAAITMHFAWALGFVRQLAVPAL